MIVLCEIGRVPGVVRNQSMDANIDVLTTRAFLDAMQKRQEGATPRQAPEEESCWGRVPATGAAANPRVQSCSQRRSKP